MRWLETVGLLSTLGRSAMIEISSAPASAMAGISRTVIGPSAASAPRKVVSVKPAAPTTRSTRPAAGRVKEPSARVIAAASVSAVADGPAQSFRTLAAQGAPVFFAVLGDTRDGHDVHAKLAARLAQEAPDFVINTGDLVFEGEDGALWPLFFHAEQPLLAVAPLFAAP